MWSYGVTSDGRQPARKPDGSTDSAETEPKKEARPARGPGSKLTPDQQQVVSELQTRDRAVRAHEAAHKAVGGSLAGGMSFSYQTGPDGRQYAVGGEVSIDTGGERDPKATIAKMRQVIAAALAPADPSSQDLAVAGQAQASMAEAQRQVTQAQGASSKDAEKKQAGEDAAAKQKTAASGYGTRPEAAGGLLNLVA